MIVPQGKGEILNEKLKATKSKDHPLYLLHHGLTSLIKQNVF